VAAWELIVLAPTNATVQAGEILRAPGDLFAAVQATASLQLNVPLGMQTLVRVQGSATINGKGAAYLSLLSVHLIFYLLSFSHLYLSLFYRYLTFYLFLSLICSSYLSLVATSRHANTYQTT
jgi:hypothetical protein